MAKLKESSSGFMSLFQQQLGMLVSNFLDRSFFCIFALAVDLLTELSSNFLVGFIPNLNYLLLLELPFEQIVLIHFIESLGLGLSFFVLLQQKYSNIFETNIEYKFAQPRLLKVVILKHLKHNILASIQPVQLKVDIKLVPELPKFPRLSTYFSEVVFALLQLRRVPALLVLNNVVQKIFTAPAHLGIHLQAPAQYFDPHQRVLPLPLLIVFVLAVFAEHPQHFVLHIDQLVFYVLLFLNPRQAQPLGPQQSLPVRQQLVQSAPEGVNVHFCVEYFDVGYLGGFVVVGPAVAVGFGVVSVSNFGHPEIDEVHLLHINLSIGKNQVVRFEIPMNNPQSLFLLLPLLPGPEPPQHIIVQIVQNLGTPSDKLDDGLLILPGFDDAAEGASLGIFGDQVEFSVLELEDIFDLEDVVPVPLIVELFKYHQLSVPVILRFPFLRLLELFDDYLFVRILLLLIILALFRLLGCSHNGSVYDPEAPPPQEHAPVYLVVGPRATYGHFWVGQPPLLQLLRFLHTYQLSPNITNL